MTELLVSVADKTHRDPKINAKLFKKGDLVTAMPDGHKWGREERNPDKFTIIRIPDLDIHEARNLCMPDFELNVGKKPGAPGPGIRRARRFMIDENRLPPKLQERLRQSREDGKPLETVRQEILGPALIDKREI